MVGNSKILTVSYGTFSCTLEGFDDSFDTMKAIAEYFRDLAADDRYFGAEPPQPDADLLAKIAEKELSRRVQGHADGNAIHLRPAGLIGAANEVDANDQAQDVAAQRDADAKAQAERAQAEAAARLAAETAEAERQAEEAAEEAQRVAEAEAEAERIAQAEAEAKRAAEAEAERLAQEEAKKEAARLAEEAEAQRLAEEEAEAERKAAEEAEAERQAAEDAEAARLAEEEAEAQRLAEEQAAREAEEAAAREAEEEAARIAEEAEAQRLAEEEAETERLAAEEAEAERQAEEAAAQEAEEEAQRLAEEQRAEEERLAQEEADRVAAEAADAQDDAEESAPETDGDATIAAARAAAMRLKSEADQQIARISQAARDVRHDAAPETVEDTNEDDRTEEATATEVEAPAPAAQDGESIADKLQRIRAVVAPAASADTSLDYTEDEHADVPTDAETMDAIADSEPDADEAPAPRARLIKVRRPVEDTAEQAEADAALTDDAVSTEDDTPSAASSLSDEDEAALLRDLAAATAEDAEEDAPVLDAEISEDVQDEVSAEMAETEAVEEDCEEEAADEVWAETAEALEEERAEDPQDHEDAKAAIGAIMGDEGAAPKEDTAEPRDESLATAEPVAEDAPVAKKARTSLSIIDRIFRRTEAELDEPDGKTRRAAITQMKAAVAATEAARQMGEDNDDRAKTEEAFRQDLAEAVRPKRPEKKPGTKSQRPAAPLRLVPAQRVDDADAPKAEAVKPRRIGSEVAAGDAADGFAAYAEEQGAYDLADLLEAAAAYTSVVEGRTTFTRLQIMRRAIAASDEDVSREDSLRRFGTLIRQGKIEKVAAGQFQITEATRFVPDREAS